MRSAIGIMTRCVGNWLQLWQDFVLHRVSLLPLLITLNQIPVERWRLKLECVRTYKFFLTKLY